MGKEKGFGTNLKRYIGEKPNNIETKKHLFGKPLAMDIGTTNTRIFMQGEGVVLDEPSVVAYEKFSKEILATGSEAKSYLGRTPQNIEVIRPLQGGFISDFDLIQDMIKEFLLKVQKKKRLFKSKLIISVPVNISSAEKKVIFLAAKKSGIGKIYFIENPLAAAIGTGLNISNKKGQMLLDVGGGSVGLSVISVASVVYGDVEKVGGDAINDALADYLLEKHQLQVGIISAEKCKIEAADAFLVNGKKYNISGKDIETYIPKEVTLEPEEISKAIKEPLRAIVGMIKKAFDEMPDELKPDIVEDGIYVTGGGSLLKGFYNLIENETKLCCHAQEEPFYTALKGASEAIKNRRKYKKVLMKR